ncbi:hypothetical protein BWI17_17940 [Betaproteobacteria bacterium GR16-43]|nr:hypothetical protein BWI17_17940 [Betaproteobacteria bacterium GR16-43]
MGLERDLALAMGRAQADFNAARDPDWLKAGWPFLRAAAVEGARALDRLDWKWWKREEGGNAAIGESLAAIWGHGLSHLLVERHGNFEELAKYLAWSSRHSPGNVRTVAGLSDPKGLDLAGRLDLLVGLCSVGRFPLAVLADLFASCGVDWESLAAKHLGDLALRGFRLERNANECAVVAFGDGREDREHLCELLPHVDIHDEQACAKLRAALGERHRVLVATQERLGKKH